MGADFLYEILPRCDMTDERKRILANAIDRMTEENFQDGLDGDEDLEKQKDILRFSLDEYVSYTSSWSREIGELVIHGEVYLITGGMSWGDAPTYAYEHFETLRAIPDLWETLVAWMREDIQKIKKAIAEK